MRPTPGGPCLSFTRKPTEMMNPLESEAMKAILFAFSSVPHLRKGCVLKGGNALKIAYNSPRASVDLDFTLANAFTTDADIHERLLDDFCDSLKRGLSRAETRYPLYLRITRAVVRPQDQNPRTFPGFELKIGFADKRKIYRPGEIDRYFQHNTLKIDVSLNEVICENAPFQLGEFTLDVATLNDIIAEKLRAILQQIPRKRSRPGDFYDIWYFYTHHREALDTEKISAFLIGKTEGRENAELRISKASFANPEIRERGAIQFTHLGDTVAAEMPTFEEAAGAVMNLVAELEIPER